MLTQERERRRALRHDLNSLLSEVARERGVPSQRDLAETPPRPPKGGRRRRKSR